MDADKIINKLGLMPLEPEGGFYKETFRSEYSFTKVKTAGKYKDRSICSAIYYLLTPDTFSEIHRLSSDEIYHFYLGDPVKMLLLYEDGSSDTVILGSDLSKGYIIQFTVPKDTWQGSFLLKGGRFALMGTTVTPAFEPHDYIAAKRDDLIKRYSDRIELIKRLTR